MAKRGRPPGTGEHGARIYLRLPEALRQQVIAVAGEEYAPWVRAAMEEKLQRDTAAQSGTHKAKSGTHR